MDFLCVQFQFTTKHILKIIKKEKLRLETIVNKNTSDKYWN